MKIKALIILIVLTLSLITQAKLPPPGSTKGAKANILIMLDMSGSMYVEWKWVCKKNGIHNVFQLMWLPILIATKKLKIL